MRRDLSMVPIAFMAMVLCFCPSNAAGEPPKVEELLTQYTDYVDGLRTIAFDSSKIVYEKGGPFPGWTWTWLCRFSFARAENRWRYQDHSVGFSFYERPLPLDSVREDVFDGKSFFMVIRDDRGARHLPTIDLQSGWKRLDGGGTGPWEMDVSAELGAQNPKTESNYAVLFPTMDLYGFIWADHLFIGDMLREKTTRLSSRKEAIDGRTCSVLEGATSHGTLTLWLDSASDHAPLRLRLWKEGDDLMGQTPMRLQRPHESRLTRPNLPVRQYEYQVDFRTRPVGKRTAIAGYVCKERYIHDGGSQYEVRSEFTLDHMRFDPKPEDLKPTLPIPEGTRVMIVNAPQTKAKWSKGQVVLGDGKSSLP